MLSWLMHTVSIHSQGRIIACRHGRFFTSIFFHEHENIMLHPELSSRPKKENYAGTNKPLQQLLREEP